MQSLRFVVPYGEQAHRHLWVRLSNCGDTQVMHAGADLNDLRRLRNQCDYDIHLTVLRARAQAQITRSEQIINLLDNLSPTTRILIRDAMKIYERDVLQDVTWTP